MPILVTESGQPPFHQTVPHTCQQGNWPDIFKLKMFPSTHSFGCAIHLSAVHHQPLFWLALDYQIQTHVNTSSSVHSGVYKCKAFCRISSLFLSDKGRKASDGPSALSRVEPSRRRIPRMRRLWPGASRFACRGCVWLGRRYGEWILAADRAGASTRAILEVDGRKGERKEGREGLRKEQQANERTNTPLPLDIRSQSVPRRRITSPTMLVFFFKHADVAATLL